MPEDGKLERIKRMEEYGKWGSNHAAAPQMNVVKSVTLGRPKEITEARQENKIWCKNCIQELPATSMKDFSCPVCGSREYQTVRPF